MGAKSPLSEGIKEANAGGISGQKLGRLGLAAIILERKRASGRIYLLFISKSEVKLEEANEIRGAGNYEVSAKLRKRFGPHVGIISIGQAGEMLMSASTVAMVDPDGIPCRHAARGGLGAVSVVAPREMK